MCGSNRSISLRHKRLSRVSKWVLVVWWYISKKKLCLCLFSWRDPRSFSSFSFSLMAEVLAALEQTGSNHLATASWLHSSQESVAALAHTLWGLVLATVRDKAGLCWSIKKKKTKAVCQSKVKTKVFTLCEIFKSFIRSPLEQSLGRDPRPVSWFLIQCFETTSLLWVHCSVSLAIPSPSPSPSPKSAVNKEPHFASTIDVQSLTAIIGSGRR